MARASTAALSVPRAATRTIPRWRPWHWRVARGCANDGGALTADSRTDAELLAAFCRGDADAFEVLYLRHRAFVLRVARRFAPDDDEALDVLQEAFAWLIRKAPGLRLRHRLTTLLYPVAKHLGADRRRKRARGPRALDDVALGADAADEPAVEMHFGEDVRDWFAGLGPLQQEVLALRFADELSLEEIAAALGVPLGTAKSRLHHALQQLRERLGDD